MKLKLNKGLVEIRYYPFGLTMAGISSKAAGGLENKKKYNGIEFENDFDISVYDAFYRELDPQIGRFIEIDPKTEDMYLWSPYVSNFDNPITYSDPLGDEPEGDVCCGGFIDKVMEIGKGALLMSGGIANAWSSNQMLGAGRVDVNEQSSLSYGSKLLVKAGQFVGDVASVVTGAAEIVVAGSGEVASFGVASPVAIPVGIHGSSAIGMGVTNLIKGATNPVKNDRVNSSSANGNSKQSQKSQHNYDIEDTHNNNTPVKTGTSGGKETKSGVSYRGTSQANRWNKQEGTPGRYVSRTTNRVPSGPGARQKALDYETKRGAQLAPTLDPTKHKRPR